MILILLRNLFKLAFSRIPQNNLYHVKLYTSVFYLILDVSCL